MLEISSTTTRQAGFGEPRIVELGRGTAHPHAGMTTRERVARSLLLRPDAAPASRPARR